MLYPVELRAHGRNTSREVSGKKARTLMKLFTGCKPPNAGVTDGKKARITAA
jgi:hypothetical protein